MPSIVAMFERGQVQMNESLEIPIERLSQRLVESGFAEKLSKPGG